MTKESNTPGKGFIPMGFSRKTGGREPYAFFMIDRRGKRNTLIKGLDKAGSKMTTVIPASQIEKYTSSPVYNGITLYPDSELIDCE